MNSYTKQIAQIATALDGKVNCSSIQFTGTILGYTPQELEAKGNMSYNHYLFIGRMFGMNFYTRDNILERICYLEKFSKEDTPTYIVLDDSQEIFQIK